MALQLAQWRDLYQEVFVKLLIQIAQEVFGITPARELWPDVLNFFSLQALLLPPRAAEERPPDLVHQAAILYAASHAVDDL